MTTTDTQYVQFEAGFYLPAHVEPQHVAYLMSTLVAELSEPVIGTDESGNEIETTPSGLGWTLKINGVVVADG